MGVEIHHLTKSQYEKALTMLVESSESFRIDSDNAHSNVRRTYVISGGGNIVLRRNGSMILYGVSQETKRNLLSRLL